MRLSRFERELLIHMLSIRKAVEGQTGRVAKEADEHIEILRDGFEVFYESALAACPDAEVFPRAAGSFVLDVLTMYRGIEVFKSERPEEAKALVGKRFATFQGFDGNAEAGHLGFTRFLIETQSKFAEQLPHAEATLDWNAHEETIPAYARMLLEFRRIDMIRPMAAERCIAIVDAASPPKPRRRTKLALVPKS